MCLRNWCFAWFLGLALFGPFPTNATEPVELLAKGELPGTARDLSGLTGDVETGVPRDLLGGFSGLEYTGADHRYWVLTDRGPADGANSYPCRVHQIDLVRPESGHAQFTPRLVATHLLRDESGTLLTGRSTEIDADDARRSRRFDPEAIRRGPDNTLIISDEYGPDIVSFSAAGNRLRRWEIPTAFRVQQARALREEENNANVRGRRSNGGFEGLAVTPSGQHLAALTQRPLLQDSEQQDAMLTGRFCRLLVIHWNTGESRQLVYPLDRPTHGLNELLAWDEQRFLTIERDDAPGPDAQYKRIMVIDTAKASDVSHVDRLPTDNLPAKITPVRKEVLIDLLDPRWGLRGEAMPEKIEGLAWGPTLPDGRRLLVICSDNDCDPKEPSRFWMFAVGAVAK